MNLVGKDASGAELYYSSTVRITLAFKTEQKAIMATEKTKKETKKA